MHVAGHMRIVGRNGRRRGRVRIAEIETCTTHSVSRVGWNGLTFIFYLTSTYVYAELARTFCSISLLRVFNYFHVEPNLLIIHDRVGRQGENGRRCKHQSWKGEDLVYEE